MSGKIYKWTTKRFSRSNFKLLNKIARSLERDREIPFRYLLRKALIYFTSMVTARFNLLRCDRVGKRPRTRHRPYIENMGKIILGNDVNINSRNVKTDMVTGPGAILEIENEVSINFGVSIVANKRIKIGNRVRIGPYTMIYDSNQHIHGARFKRAGGHPVVIEDDVWLASRVLILEGSRIGRGSLIASGSVVSGIIPPYVVAAGSPARVIKFLETPEDAEFTWNRAEDNRSPHQEVLLRVRKVVSDLLAVDPDSLGENCSHNSWSEWDSFQQVKFIYALENEFSIKFKKKDLARIKSIRRAAGIIQEYLENESNINDPVEQVINH